MWIRKISCMFSLLKNQHIIIMSNVDSQNILGDFITQYSTYVYYVISGYVNLVLMHAFITHVSCHIYVDS